MDFSTLVNAVSAGFSSVFTWPAFGFLLLGIAIGFAVGILPGLGGPVVMAIMLPFTFDMGPVEAFSFLLGMVAATATSGDITSILFGVPGEPASAALVVDGYPLTKQGQAGRALGAALLSSMIGALIGAFALVAAVPIVRPLVLSFGSPEFFMLTVLGISCVAALSSGQVLKGLIAGGLGLMVSMIGLDPQSGTERYTFGQLSLWDGVGLVPAALGLFAIPELIDLARRGTSIADTKIGKIGGVMEGVKDTFRYFGLTVRCSLIGTFLGLIPGLGASVAQWITYSHAVQTGKEQGKFGKGAIEGVLGPGAANNSKEGAGLIPTVAFGIPSGVSTAILLGAFLIQGLTPGPSMLTTNLPLTMSFVWMIVVSNVITVVVCFLFIRQIVMITFIRAGILIPCIVLMVYIGAFAENNSMMGLLTMVLFGGVGVIFTYLDWPKPPLILGLVLGHLTENYLFLSVARYDATFLTHPIVLVLIGLSIIVVAQPFISSALSQRRVRAIGRRPGTAPALVVEDR